MKKLTHNINISDDDLYDVFSITEDVADERGCEVVYPKDNELFIDIDSEEQYEAFLHRIAVFNNKAQHHLCAKIIRYEPSQSGLPNRHITLEMHYSKPKLLAGKLESIPYVPSCEWEKICLQFYFCSDFNRESLNTMRLSIQEGADSGNCFFQPIEDED